MPASLTHVGSDVRCGCLKNNAVVDKPSNRCNRKPTQRRIWGGQIILFCPLHADEWDDVVTFALRGFYEERFGNQYLLAG